MRHQNYPIASMFAIILALSACGAVSETESTSTSSPPSERTTVTSSSPTTTEESKEASITIENFSFEGATNVTVGTTVTVTNHDGVTHTWTSADGVWNSGGLGGGESFEFTFDEPGEYAYFCSIHPTMTGTVIVEG